MNFICIAESCQARNDSEAVRPSVAIASRMTFDPETIRRLRIMIECHATNIAIHQNGNVLIKFLTRT